MNTVDSIMALADAYAAADCAEHHALENESGLVFEQAIADTQKARAALLAALQEFAAEQAGGPVAYIAWKDGKPCYEGDDAICEDAVWPVDSDDDRTSMPVFTAPQPAQPESIECECGRIHKKTSYGWASSEPAQPVAQPNIQNQIVKDISRHEPCHTCAHYQQGKLPGVRIHDETCYECRSYWGNKWEAA